MLSAVTREISGVGHWLESNVKELLVPVGPLIGGWEIISLIPCYLAASPVVCRDS